MSVGGWIGVDLDGTLASYTGWKGPDQIGDPIPAMAIIVRNLILKGATIKIFTARACIPEEIPHVKAWLVKHGFGDLEVTNVKDFGMVALFDDRAIAVGMNSGKILGANPEVLKGLT